MFLRVRLASLSLHVGFFFVSVSGYCVKLLRLLVLVAQLCRGPGLRGVQLQARFSPQPVPPPDVVTVSKKATDAICTVLTATSRGRARNQGQLLPVRGSGLLSKGHRAHRGHHRMWRGQGHTSGGQSVRERSGPSDLCCFPVGRHQRRRAGCRRPAKTPAVPSASARDAYHSASPGMSLVAPAAATPAPQLRARSLSPRKCGRGRGPSGGRPAPAGRRAGPAASPPAPSGLASRVSPRPRATLPAVRSAVWSQGRRRKRRPLCTAAPPPVSAASRGHPDRRGSTSCGCAGTCPLPAVCGAACSHVSARRLVGMGLCRGACSVPCVSDTEALAAGRQLPLTCLLFPLPNKVLMLTRSFSWEEWAHFLCRLQPVNTGCLFTWVCPRQHFTISSMYFCVCLVKFTPKCPTFWGLAVNGTVLIPAPRVCCWVHPAGRPPWPCIP